MKHIFHKGTDLEKPTFLLLHGTGGTETDLLPIAGMIDDSASVLGVRGNISENGMPRFFKRLAEGVFDEEDLIKQTKELHQFLDTAADDHNFNRDHLLAIGYSNGANIAASLLFHYQNSLQGAVLLHPMVPRRGIELPDLTGLPVFIGAGTNDPICSPEETRELAEMLEKSGATVEVHWENQGHQLTKSEIDKAAEWYRATSIKK
ncbi:alpha/beta hydrolase [Halobacillus naozhouensis]|uniref:Alpha/beta hydrolase n=1 Tax=Halobacillus naozhouensis TaxID=554880 RepID=A0ABY8IZ52_9BACI|nr:alpha/beta hydrolase [Halobacillus naozhouensis]WFT75340.1 alpha/beta hydrolase [Halobacillus naozhouensis]